MESIQFKLPEGFIHRECASITELWIKIRKSIWEVTAWEYDEFVISQWRAELSQLSNQILTELLDPNKQYKVLEVWCGTGIFTDVLSKNINMDVIWIDLHNHFINYAVEKLRASKDQLAVADFYKLPFWYNSFDIFTWLAVLHYRSDINAFYQEVIRVTKPWWLIFFPFPVNKKDLIEREKEYLNWFPVEVIQEWEWYFVWKVCETK